MDKVGEQSKEIVAIYANKLPAEIVGRFMQNLSVGDRLKSEGVSPRWKGALSKWGWTEQKRLDWGVVFEGATEEAIECFWEPPFDDRSCHLVSLLYECAPWLRELDLNTFGQRSLGWRGMRFLPQIIESFSSLNTLEKLDFRGIHLRDFLERLPSTLRELKSYSCETIEEFEALSVRCPNLEEVPFKSVGIIYSHQIETVIKLIGKFPRQKKLDLRSLTFISEEDGRLASIGQLKEVEELAIYECDGKSFEAIVDGCQRLRTLDLNTSSMTEEALFQLAKCLNLTTLKVQDCATGVFTDAVVKAIAQRGQLKKLIVDASFFNPLSDDSVEYLMDRCKSLVSLHFYVCPQITGRSLEAIIAEVRRRHGWPPRSLPNGPLDEGIFYCSAYKAESTWDRARELMGDNPWIRFGGDPRKIV